MMRKFSIQQGMTLIELMVSMVIGMFLILGAVTVYTQGRQNYQANEAVARLQENVRFSMSVMEPDIQLVGHWGLNNIGVDPASITVAVSCDGTDVSDWALDVLNGVTAVDNIQAADADEVADNCPAFGGGIVVDTDMLVLRHASGKEEVFNDGSIQVQSSHAESHLIDDGAMHPQHADLIDGTTTQTYDLNVNAWYVSEDSNAMEGVPSLRRRTLIGDEMIDEEVIAGVENMQIDRKSVV